VIDEAIFKSDGINNYNNTNIICIIGTKLIYTRRSLFLAIGEILIFLIFE